MKWYKLAQNYTDLINEFVKHLSSINTRFLELPREKTTVHTERGLTIGLVHRVRGPPWSVSGLGRRGWSIDRLLFTGDSYFSVICPHRIRRDLSDTAVIARNRARIIAIPPQIRPIRGEATLAACLPPRVLLSFVEFPGRGRSVIGHSAAGEKFSSIFPSISFYAPPFIGCSYLGNCVYIYIYVGAN